ncbi:MAG: ACT domain-containing protein [Wenzhouxiangellaceae bacterium]|nr:ACT domain-containing protein [Wenzhouxiangellaceae bacterium]
MSVQFEIRLTLTEGALLRTIGLIQRRGFSVHEMALRHEPGRQLLSLSLESEGRCPNILARQINRLHDVERVERLESESWQTTMADCVRALGKLLPVQEQRSGVAIEMGR